MRTHSSNSVTTRPAQVSAVSMKWRRLSVNIVSSSTWPRRSSRATPWPNLKRPRTPKAAAMASVNEVISRSVPMAPLPVEQMNDGGSAYAERTLQTTYDNNSDEVGDAGRHPLDRSWVHRPVLHGPRQLVGHGGGDHLGRRRGVVHAPACAVALEAVGDVEVLLEVVAEREVEEGPVVGRELHRRGQPTLDDGQVAHRQVPVQGGHIGPHGHAVT